MKAFVVVVISCMSLLGLTRSVSAQDDEKYSRRYDNIDVDLIFRTRLLSNFVDCLLDKKPCSPEGKDLKNVLPDALRTRCSSCTKIQKAKALDAITRLYYQHPDKYLALAERYDPTGEYTRNFENWFDSQNGVKPRNEGNPFPSKTTTEEPVRQQNPNRIPTERTRIPSTWITTTSTPRTTQRTTSRATLRTLPPTLRTFPTTVRSVETIFRQTPTTLRFIPTTQPPTPPTFRPTTRASTFRETPSTQRFFAPVTEQNPTIVRDVPRSLEPADSPQVLPERQPETIFTQATTNRPIFTQPPTTIRPIVTQPPTTSRRTQSPTVIKEIQTILRAPEPPAFAPPVERIPQPTFAQPTTNFRPFTSPITQPTVRTTTAAPTLPPPVITREPPRLPEARPPQTFSSPEQRNSNPVFDSTTSRIPQTVRTLPPTVRTPAQPSINRESPPVFNAPEDERLQPRFGDSEPRTREIFSDSEPSRTPQQDFQPIDLIDNFFVPNGNRPFRRSINQLWSTTNKVVNNVRGMVRSTISVIAGTK